MSQQEFRQAQRGYRREQHAAPSVEQASTICNWCGTWFPLPDRFATFASSVTAQTTSVMTEASTQTVLEEEKKQTEDAEPSLVSSDTPAVASGAIVDKSSGQLTADQLRQVMEQIDRNIAEFRQVCEGVHKANMRVLAEPPS